MAKLTKHIFLKMKNNKKLNKKSRILNLLQLIRIILFLSSNTEDKHINKYDEYKIPFSSEHIFSIFSSEAVDKYPDNNLNSDWFTHTKTNFQSVFRAI